MPYTQYTKCIEPEEYTDFNHMLVATFQSLLVGLTASAIVLAKNRGDWRCWLMAVAVMAAAWVIAYCRLFLYQRLICLGGDRDAIGMVVNIEYSHLTGLPDNDLSVNLLVEPNEPGTKRSAVEISVPYGFLVHEQDKIQNRGLPTEGYEATDPAGRRSEVLHAEFEGAGPYGLLIGAEIGFAAAVAALILCVYVPPIPFVHEIMWALFALALLAIVIGGALGWGSGGSTSDVDPSLGELHTNDANGVGADILYVQGTWVYDPWHTGWNEIHPIKVCMRMRRWDGDWDLPGDVILRIRSRLNEAGTPETQTAQLQPENRWAVHPSLDGCAPVVIT